MSPSTTQARQKKKRPGTELLKVTVNSKEFLKACAVVAQAINTRPVVPVYGYIRVELSEGKLFFCGSNLNQTVKTSFEHTSEANGSFLFPADIGLNLLRSLPDGPIGIGHFVNSETQTTTTTGGTSTVTQDAYRLELEIDGKFYILETENPKDYSIPVKPTEYQEIYLTVHELTKSMTYCKDSVISEKAGRPSLEGILISIVGESLTVVSSDASVLIERKTLIQNSDGISTQATVPVGFANLLSIFSAEIAAVRFHSNSLEVSDGTSTVETLVCAEPFPDYAPLLPKSSVSEVLLSMESLKSTFSRSAFFADKTSGTTKLSFSENELLVEVPPGAYSNESLESIEIAQWSGPSADVWLNIHKASRILSKVHSQDVEIKLNGWMRPVMVHPKSDPGLTILVMPVDPEKL
ncbi:MAG: hypothetical protein J7619_23075 [Dyadobacter sp.]|uniref:hypothetical protein n=1 Tax=Dyadobacter sp. TaxID=1914288 RepID=UPI001B100F1C|nr:hypothetical protein [Dyadobacter sp.]MBO9615598.1 hypothetical protein [Dyadobacter sp.]